MGLRQAASEHVTNSGWNPLLIGGLEDVELLLETPQLAENFPGLADPAKVQAMRTTLDARLKEITASKKKLGASDYQSVITDVLAANDATVQIPK